MREIKFRAWVPVNSDEPKRMEYFDLGIIDDVERLAVADYDVDELMMFTGFKDKNKVEIFQGDVVMVTLEKGYKNIKYKPATAVVVWTETAMGVGLGLEFIGNEHYGWRLPWMDEINEVIGNIYENKNLIERH